MRRAAFVAATMLAACGGGEEADEPDASVDAAVDAPRPPPGNARGTFDLTYYWVTSELDYGGAATEAIYTPRCEVLATVSPEFARSLRLEGTGRLRDGRVINVSGACGCASATCFIEVDEDHPWGPRMVAGPGAAPTRDERVGRWGIGVQDRPLVPYRSVAVDRAVVPYGTRLWIAELEGVRVPGEPPWGDFVHDGCVLAADTGGSIDGAHLDWFVGLKASYRTLDGALRLSRITVHDAGDRCP
jgi:3D (Asp-Asp-Asp) domain-containing protein